MYTYICYIHTYICIHISYTGSSIASTSVNDEEKDPKLLQSIYYTEIGFTCFFFFELLLNLLGNIRFSDSLGLMMRDSLKWIVNGWNLIDVLVILVSLACVASNLSSVVYMRTIRVHMHTYLFASLIGSIGSDYDESWKTSADRLSFCMWVYTCMYFCRCPD